MPEAIPQGPAVRVVGGLVDRAGPDPVVARQPLRLVRHQAPRWTLTPPPGPEPHPGVGGATARTSNQGVTGSRERKQCCRRFMATASNGGGARRDRPPERLVDGVTYTVVTGLTLASDNHIVVTPRPRVCVVGAGFGGLAAVRGLAGAPVDVTVVDQDNYHGFWPLLYQVASSELAPEDIAAPIRAMMSGRSDVEVRLGTVERVDLDGRRVCLADGTELRFDYLIVAGGTVTSDFGIPGVSAHAYTLKTLPDAVRLRNHVLRAFERADALAEGSGTPPSRPVTIVVAGGGSTGVEMAGALAELIRHNLAGDFRHLDLSRARVVLVEMTDHLLPGFSPKSQAAAAATLHRLGVDVRLSTSIATVEVDGVTVTPRDGGSPERIEADTVVWTAGVRANPLGACLAGDLKWGGRVPVEADLTLPGHPEVFVVGDMAAATDRHGQPLPQVAQVAIQGGRHAARCIARRLGGRPTRRFRYHDHGSMATIGRRSAVAELPGGLVVTGTAGWLAWLGVHLVFLVGFRKRALVLATWAWNYITWDRASRVIMETRDRSA